MRVLSFAAAAVLGAAMAPAPANALSELEACVTIGVTGQKFKLRTLIDDGAGLNTLSRSEKYEEGATYVVVLWTDGAESVIKLDDPEPTEAGSKGIDLQGNEWRVSTDLENCS